MDVDEVENLDMDGDQIMRELPPITNTSQNDSPNAQASKKSKQVNVFKETLYETCILSTKRKK